MKVIINEESIRKSKSKLSKVIFAEFFLETEYDEFFPEYGWDDFASIVIDWWIEESIIFLKNKDNAIFRFMDGPFYLKIEKSSGENCIFSFFKDPIFLYSKEASPFDFFSSLLKASNVIIRKADIFHYEEDEITNIKKNQNLLRRLLKSYKS